MTIDNHGTPAGYQRHRYWGEPACDECKAAWSEYYRERRASNKETTDDR